MPYLINFWIAGKPGGQNFCLNSISKSFTDLVQWTIKQIFSPVVLGTDFKKKTGQFPSISMANNVEKKNFRTQQRIFNFIIINDHDFDTNSNSRSMNIIKLSPTMNSRHTPFGLWTSNEFFSVKGPRLGCSQVGWF